MLYPESLTELQFFYVSRTVFVKIGRYAFCELYYHGGVSSKFLKFLCTTISDSYHQNITVKPSLKLYCTYGKVDLIIFACNGLGLVTIKFTFYTI